MFIIKLLRSLLIVSVISFGLLSGQSKAKDTTEHCDVCLTEVLVPMHIETTSANPSQIEISALYAGAIYGRCITMQEFKRKMSCEEMVYGYTEMMLEYIKDQAKIFSKLNHEEKLNVSSKNF